MMDGSTVGDGDAKTLWIGDLVRARSRQDDVAETRVAMRYFFSTTTPSTRRATRRRRRNARRDPPPIPPRADADALPAPPRVDPAPSDPGVLDDRGVPVPVLRAPRCARQTRAATDAISARACSSNRRTRHYLNTSSGAFVFFSRKTDRARLAPARGDRASLLWWASSGAASSPHVPLTVASPSRALSLSSQAASWA